VRAAEAARYDAVLIDEFQDLNEPQYRIVRALASGRRNVFAVGDDAQAIYAWRGADPGIFRRFLQDFPGTRVTLLEECYRCVQAILDAAGALPTGAVPKRLRSARGPGRRPAAYSAADREEEARMVAEAASFMLTWLMPDGLAVLARRRQDLKGLSAALTAARVPHQVVGGTAFLDRAEVKLAAALLAAAAGRATDADARRIAEALIPGVGEGTLKKLLAWAAERGAPLIEAFSHAREAGAGKAQADALEAFSRRVRTWRALPFGPTLFNRVLEESGLLAALEGDRERLANAARLREMAASAADVDEFFAGLALAAGDCVEEAGRARVMTMHAAKGRGFEAVMVPGLADCLVPGDDDWADEAEEARVLYVALTRARDDLRLFWPRSVGPWRARPSRFLVRMGPFLEGGVKAAWA
jgi:superfamily I DNA/RNA helicase